MLCAEYLGLPLIQINLKNFRDEDSETAERFASKLKSEIASARTKRPDGKFLLLLDEMDKLAEKDPDGGPIDRPVMGIINDLLNHGVSTVGRSDSSESTEGDSSGRPNLETSKLNLKAAFVALTLNFGNRNLGFSADARMTSVEDIRRLVK
jgi:hypothetical protein